MSSGGGESAREEMDSLAYAGAAMAASSAEIGPTAKKVLEEYTKPIVWGG